MGQKNNVDDDDSININLQQFKIYTKVEKHKFRWCYIQSN